MLTRRKIKPKEAAPKTEAFDVTLARLKKEAEAERVSDLNGTLDQGFDARLEEIDPRSLLTVMTEVANYESAFTNGESLRQNWESSKIQRVGIHFNRFPQGYLRILCPDRKIALIQFTSERYQLLSGDNQPTGEDTMPNTKHKSPPKKGVKPVKPSSSAKPPAAPKPKKDKPEGNYLWLLQRHKSQALGALTTDANRATVREGLKTAEKFTDTVAFLERAQVIGESKIDPKLASYLNEFFSAAINR